MANKTNVTLQDRLKEQAEARVALLAKAKALSPSNRPDFAEKQAERIKVAEDREQRQAETAVRKAAEAAKRAEEKAAAAAAAEEERQAAIRAAEEEAGRAARELAELRALQKANRDAKYQARQARRDARKK